MEIIKGKIIIKKIIENKNKKQKKNEKKNNRKKQFLSVVEKKESKHNLYEKLKCPPVPISPAKSPAILRLTAAQGRSVFSKQRHHSRVFIELS